jgi:prepilin-type processing-associated H-X9-DG protein
MVVAIIAALAALAMGLYRRTKGQRVQLESAARMQQWGAALASYIADNDGTLPRRGQGVQEVTQLDRPEDWFNALPPYVGEKSYSELVKAGKRPREGDRSLFVRPEAKDPGGRAFLSYGMNMNLSPWNLAQPTRLGSLHQPGSTVFLAEAPGPYASTYPSRNAYSCVAPHNGWGNILFLDGHVAAYTAEYLGADTGDPRREDVHWLTGTESDAQAGNY